MKKLFPALLLVLVLFTSFVSALELRGSATVEADLVVKARTLPPTVGTAGDLVGFSLVNYLNNFDVSRFTELCSDQNRLKARLRTIVNKDAACRGTKEVVDSCFTAPTVCDALTSGGCEASEGELVSTCVAHWDRRKQQNVANPGALETAIFGRCKSLDLSSIVQSCQAGEAVSIGVGVRAGAPGIQEACVARGYVYAQRGSFATCEPSEGTMQSPILTEQSGIEFPGDPALGQPVFGEELFEEVPFDEFTEGEFGENFIFDEFTESEFDEFTEGFVFEDEFPSDSTEQRGVDQETRNATTAGVANQTTADAGAAASRCPARLESCPTGYELQTGVDSQTRCSIDQCVEVQAPETASPSCSETDGGANVFQQGTVTVISSKGRLERTDRCPSASAITEYYCVGTTVYLQLVSCAEGCEQGACKQTASTSQPAPPSTPESATQSRSTTDDASTETTAASYSCTDTENGVTTNVAGVVKLTTPTNTYTVTDTCVNPTLVREYFCSAANATRISSSTVSCPTGTCSNGICSTPTKSTSTASTSANESSTSTSTTSTTTTTSGSSTTETAPPTGASGTTSNTTTSSSTTSTDTTASYLCEDTDGGIVEGVKGTAKVTRPTGLPITRADYCSGSRVLEFYCASSISSSLTAKFIDCPNGCVDGACVSPPTTTTTQIVAPFTVRVVAYPSVLTALAVGDEANIVDSSQCTEDQFLAQCRSQLRAAALGSFSPGFVQRECQTEAKANKALFSKFCQRPDNAFNECTQHVESVCSKAREAAQLCDQLEKEQLVEQLAEIVLNKCEAKNLGVESELGDVLDKLPPASAVVAIGAGEKLVGAQTTVEKTTRPKDVLYSFQQMICLKYSEEKQEAGTCARAIQEIDTVLTLYTSLKDQLPEDDKPLVEKELQKVRAKRDLFAKKCNDKNKNAGGLCSAVFGG